MDSEKQETIMEKALKLSGDIQAKCQQHKALSIAIGAIHYQFEDLTDNEKANNDADISYVPILINLSLEITKQVDEMSEKLEEMIFNLKPENHN
jgi:hypothetical protein